MKNLDPKPFYQSTVFQVVVSLYMFPAALLYYGGEISGETLLRALFEGVSLYMAKEIVAKGSEAYRDRGA